MRGLAKWAAAVAVGAGSCLGLMVMSASVAEAAPASSVVDCSTYTPSALSLSKTSVEPGEVVTISGNGGIGDAVSFTISGSGVTSTNLGSGTIGSTGTFMRTLQIPDAYPAGTYTITVRSTKCSRTGTVSITLKSVDRSGCASGNPLTLVRGASTNWKLVNTTPPFDTTKPVSLTLTRRTVGGVSYSLYSGTWPPSGTKAIVAPAAAPLDQYYLIQAGKRVSTGAAISVSCPVRVTDPPSTPSGAPLMAPRLAIAAVGAVLLLKLRKRHRKAGASAA